MKLNLKILYGNYTVHRLNANSEIPKQLFQKSFYSITKTDEELSIVCDSSIKIESKVSEKGWSCIKVVGPLDFALTGILAGISTVLAEAEVSIFAISTFDTDYILVKTDKLKDAKQALENQEYNFKN